MDKRIVKLATEPLYVGLEDRDCSVFINSQSGDIFVDEGPGDDRINGAVFYADKEPRFYVIPAPGTGAQLLLSYRRHLVVLGFTPDVAALHEWAAAANQFLIAKAKVGSEPIAADL